MSREAQHHGSPSESDETRRVILEAARRLFMRHGYRAVSTRQVADACGLTQPALYHHFASKEELYVAVLRAEIGRMQGRLERIARRGEPFDTRLRQAARFLLLTTDYDHALMLHDLRAELGPAARDALNAAFMAGVVAPLAAIVAAGQRTGDLPDPLVGGMTPEGAGFLFLALVGHFLEQPGGPAHAEATADTLVDLLLHGLAGAPAGSADEPG